MTESWQWPSGNYNWNYIWGAKANDQFPAGNSTFVFPSIVPGYFLIYQVMACLIFRLHRKLTIFLILFHWRLSTLRITWRRRLRNSLVFEWIEKEITWRTFFLSTYCNLNFLFTICLCWKCGNYFNKKCEYECMEKENMWRTLFSVHIENWFFYLQFVTVDNVEITSITNMGYGSIEKENMSRTLFPSTHCYLELQFVTVGNVDITSTKYHGIYKHRKIERMNIYKDLLFCILAEIKFEKLRIFP